MRRHSLLVLLVVTTIASRAVAQQNVAADPARDARLAWFREAKYGLFIHWGLYAIPAGEWKGQRRPGIGEWIMNRAQDPGRRSTSSSRRSSTRSSSTPTSGCSSPRTRA